MTNKTLKQSPKKKQKGAKAQQQSSTNANGQKTNLNSKNQKKSHVIKQSLAGKEQVDMKINDQKSSKHLPCDHCQEKYYKTYSDEELRAQVVSASQYKFTNGILGCDDGHMTPYDHLIGMLKLEREETNTKFPNIFGIVKPKPAMQYSFMPLGELDVKTLGLTKSTCSAFSEQEKQNQMVIREIKLPNFKNTEIRNQVVDEVIVNIGQKLRQSNQTIQLAARVFDLVSVAQNLSTNYDPSKNSPSNLKLLAAQCLLLASKFVEVSRLYPAELVYQIKSWGHSEYDILRAGQVEEYILNIIQFDLGFLTPQQFLEMYTELMDHGMPADKCPRATCMGSRNNRYIINGLKGKAKLYAMTISNMIVSNLGHSATIKFLPSQIAALSLQLAWKAVIIDEKKTLGHLLMQDSQEHISKVDICLRESLKVFGYDISQDGGLKDLSQAVEENQKVQEFLSALGLDSVNDKKSKVESTEVKSPSKASPSKQSSTKHQDDVKQTESSSKKSTMRLFDMSPCKNQEIEKSKISKDNLKRFEMIMTNSFGLNSSSDIYPQYEATPLEKSIGITERFFGRKPKYYNIMNKSFKKQQQASDLITVKYQVYSSEFNTHINLPELFTSKVKKIQTQEIVKTLRKTWFAEGDSNDKENQKNTMNFNRPQVSTGEMTLKREMVKGVNAGTGIGSDQQHSNQQTTTDDRSILEEETMSGNQRGLLKQSSQNLFEYNPNNIQKLQLLSKAYQRMDYYSSPSSQNMSNPKYFGQNQEFRADHDVLITDDCSITDSNSQSKGAPQAEHEEMIRQLLRQHSEVTDLRELARADIGSSNNQTDDAYLAAIRTSFGGCQPIDVDTDGPIKQFPSLMDRDANGIGVYAPLRQRQGNIKIHDHMLNSSSNSPFSVDFYQRAERGGNCRTPHTPVRVNYSESVM